MEKFPVQLGAIGYIQVSYPKVLAIIMSGLRWRLKSMEEGRSEMGIIYTGTMILIYWITGIVCRCSQCGRQVRL